MGRVAVRLNAGSNPAWNKNSGGSMVNAPCYTLLKRFFNFLANLTNSARQWDIFEKAECRKFRGLSIRIVK